MLARAWVTHYGRSTNTENPLMPTADITLLKTADSLALEQTHRFHWQLQPDWRPVDEQHRRAQLRTKLDIAQVDIHIGCVAEEKSVTDLPLHIESTCLKKSNIIRRFFQGFLPILSIGKVVNVSLH